MNNFNLDIKKVFLTFAQALFAEHSEYTWNKDIVETKVLIVDSHVLHLKAIEKKKSIVLSRGSYGWQHTTLGQVGEISDQTMAQRMVGITPYTDLLSGSVVFNCLCQNGLVAEDMAHTLFTSLSGFKKQLLKNGVHKITDIAMGEETLLKTDSSIELYAVPISIRFLMQKSITNAPTNFDPFVVTDQNAVIYIEGSDFTVTTDGIVFNTAPITGTTLSITYKNALTLEEVTEDLTGTVDGENTTFTYSEPAYYYYPLLSGIETTFSGIAW